MQITVKRNQKLLGGAKNKLENSFTKTKAELKAMKNRMNNAEEQISDLEDRIIKITQSEQQTEIQMKKIKNKKKAME